MFDAPLERDPARALAVSQALIHGAIMEGRAARHLGLEKEDNPYRKYLNETGDENSRTWELARDWDSGWEHGTIKRL